MKIFFLHYDRFVLFFFVLFLLVYLPETYFGIGFFHTLFLCLFLLLKDLCDDFVPASEAFPCFWMILFCFYFTILWMITISCVLFYFSYFNFIIRIFNKLNCPSIINSYNNKEKNYDFLYLTMIHIIYLNLNFYINFCRHL